MKKLLIILFSLMSIMQTIGGNILADQGEHVVLPETNDVVIAHNAVRIPLGRILLIRKDLEYCAVKLIKLWHGKTKENRYVEYESYYQGDKTGDFSNKNVKFKKEKLSFGKWTFGIGRFAFDFGNKDVRCEHIKLACYSERWIYFYSSSQKQGDYGVELAPTIWREISEVNVFDPRIKWYRYDSKRKDITIPINKLWE